MNELATYAAHVQARLTYAALAIFFAVIVGVGVLAVYAKDINTQLLTLLVTLATATVTLATGAFAFWLARHRTQQEPDPTTTTTSTQTTTTPTPLVIPPGTAAATAPASPVVIAPLAPSEPQL
jgi:heme/copper-type cytochrome/quinol oxidase subunit 2